MAELTIICERSDSIQRFITDAITKELTLLSDGIRVTEERLREFETKYKLSTQEFLGKFSHDELHHSPDFDEWIGESRMLKRLQANARELKAIKIVVSSDYMMEQSLPTTSSPPQSEGGRVYLG